MSRVARPQGGEAEALRRLEALRPRYEQLRTERIRAEGDVERLSAELDVARAEAREELGTDDEAAIRAMIAEAEGAHARAVDEFAERIRAIDARLARLGRS